jgi:hypothetical protein
MHLSEGDCFFNLIRNISQKHVNLSSLLNQLAKDLENKINALN